ncbi:hypothetical protein E2562_022372 [Oryza meyeriana var. granulata]|uniref:DUF834 domain-containing protein n=1 Tax=Oryza meyeriana var. granulata TaxID=110450 RepID=A0A6G1DLW4_9ORYZ|nr:hypothetical protein E2562_022372 [Oryza meyeriana var. granulata]
MPTLSLILFLPSYQIWGHSEADEVIAAIRIGELGKEGGICGDEINVVVGEERGEGGDEAEGDKVQGTNEKALGA